MYESHFGLTARPFPEVTHADYYFPAESLEQARNAIVRCLTRGSGAALILGAPGTGKSMLCERLTYELQNQFPIANLNWGHPTSRRGLLQAILYKLELPYRNLDEGELRLSLIDHLTRSPNCPQGMVLIVDEAHLMTVDLLEEIRILTNVVANREPRVRLVLAGQIGLEETLANGRMQSLQQRIAARCQIVNFRREETRAYIRQAIARCGGMPGALIGDRAADMVHDLTQGTPRLINQLCDHALIMACIHGIQSVSANLMHEAWADLQQLPISLEAYRPTGGPKLQQDVIEFGNLDETVPFIPFPKTQTHQEPVADPATGDDAFLDGIAEPSSDLPREVPVVPLARPVLPEETFPAEVSTAAVLNTPPHLFGDHFLEQEPVIDRYTERARAARKINLQQSDKPTQDEGTAAEVNSPSTAIELSPSPGSDTAITPSMFTIDWTHSIDLSDVATMLESIDLNSVAATTAHSPMAESEPAPFHHQEPEIASRIEVSDDLPAYELADWDTVSPSAAISPESVRDDETDGVDALLENVTQLLTDEPTIEEEPEPLSVIPHEFPPGLRIMAASTSDPIPAATPKRNLKSLFSQLEAKTTESRS